MWSALFLHINIKIWLLHSLHLQYLMIIAAFFLNVRLRHGAGQVYRITRSLQGGYLELSRQVLNCLLTTLSLPKVNTQGNVEQLAGLTSSFKRLLPESLAPCWYSQQLFMSDSPLPPQKTALCTHPRQSGSQRINRCKKGKKSSKNTGLY